MVSIVLIFITALFFTGIIGRAKSVFAGRKGPGVCQPMKNVWLLLRKGSVFSQTSSVIFQIAPVISLSCTLVALTLVPFGNIPALFSFSYDFVLFAYLLGFGRFMMIVAALDTGSSFEGMGAAREALYSMFVEPAFMLILASFCLVTHSTSFADVFSVLGQFHLQYVLVAALGIFVFINIALVENSRMPVDDPKTHLELTMIHEVIVLDYSGFDMGLIQLTSFFKFGIFGMLISNCIVPTALPWWWQLALFFGVQILFAVIIGGLESFRARNRLNRNAQYILAITAVALIAFVLTLFL